MYITEHVKFNMYTLYKEYAQLKMLMRKP